MLNFNDLDNNTKEYIKKLHSEKRKDVNACNCLRNIIANLEEEMRKLKQNYNLQHKNNESYIKSLQLKNEELTQDKNNLIANVDALQNVINTLKSQCYSLQSKSNIIQEKSMVMQNENNALKKDNETIVDLKKNICHLRIKNNLYLESIEMLKNKVNDLQQNDDAINMQLILRKADMEILKGKLNDAEIRNEEYHKVQRNIKNVEEKNITLQQENNEHKLQISILQQKLNDSENKYDALCRENERARMNSIRCNVEEGIDISQIEKNENYKLQLFNVRTKLNDSEEKNIFLQSENEKCEQKIKDLRTIINSSDDMIYAAYEMKIYIDENYSQNNSITEDSETSSNLEEILTISEQTNFMQSKSRKRSRNHHLKKKDFEKASNGFLYYNNTEEKGLHDNAKEFMKMMYLNDINLDEMKRTRKLRKRRKLNQS